MANQNDRYFTISQHTSRNYLRWRKKDKSKLHSDKNLIACQETLRQREADEESRNSKEDGHKRKEAEAICYFRNWLIQMPRPQLDYRYREWLFNNMYQCEKINDEDFADFLRYYICESHDSLRSKILCEANGIVEDLNVEFDELKRGKPVRWYWRLNISELHRYSYDV